MLGPILAFVVAAGLLTITPGVDTALVLRSAAAHGPRAGRGAASGICAGLFAWGCTVALGLTALLAASELAFTVLKWAGAAYLVVLGLGLIARPRVAVTAASVGDDPTTRTAGARDAFRRGFLTNVLNPKVGVFYVTFVPQFIPENVSVAAFAFLLAALHVLLTCAWFAVLIALTVPLGRLLRRPRFIRVLDRLTGCVFLAFGARLAVA